MAWVLVRETSGETVKNGALLSDFRGETWILTGGQPPHKPSSTGRVSVRRMLQPVSPDSPDTSAEFYPSVVGLKWVETP